MWSCSHSGWKKGIVTNWSPTISVIDTATNNIVTTAPVVGNSSYGVVVSPDGKKVYAANCYGKSISVINTTTDTVTDTIEVGDGPRGIAVSPDGKKVYVANEDKTVYIIDTTTNTVIAVVNIKRTLRNCSYPRWEECICGEHGSILRKYFQL